MIEITGEERTFSGGILSAAISITRASFTSWWTLNTHWTKRFGWQLWLMNLAMLPVEPASMQNSGTLSLVLSSSFSKVGKDTSRNRLWTEAKYSVIKVETTGGKKNGQMSNTKSDILYIFGKREFQLHKCTSLPSRPFIVCKQSMSKI